MAFSNEYNLNVDIKRRLTSTVPTFRQGDNGVLRFKVYDNGKLFDLSTYTSSEITFVLPSGAQLIGNLDLVNDELVYNFTKAEMAEIGKIETFLSITSGLTTVSVQPFYCFIFGTMDSENLSYIGILQELIKETQDLGLSIQDIAAQVAETLQIAESELANLQSLVATITADESDRVNAENIRLQSESIRVSNEIERVNQENNRISSESQRKSAEDIRLASELTRVENENLRQETLNNLKSFNYSSVQSYVFPNTVLYNGSTFLALKNNTGITPTNDGVNWRLVAQRGVDGQGSVSSVNGMLPDENGNVVIDSSDSEAFEMHVANRTSQLHILTSASVPSDLSNVGMLFKVDGTQADIPSTITIDELANQITELDTTVNTFDSRITDTETATVNLQAELNDHVRNANLHNNYTTVTGTNALVATLPVSLTTLVESFTVRFKNTTANTGNVTLNVNGTGAKPVLRNGNLQLTSGYLKAGGVYTVVYDGTSFILQGEFGGEYGSATENEVLQGYTIITENGLVEGNLARGRRYSSGIVNSNQDKIITISGVGYMPSKIVARWQPNLVDYLSFYDNSANPSRNLIVSGSSNTYSTTIRIINNASFDLEVPFASASYVWECYE